MRSHPKDRVTLHSRVTLVDAEGTHQPVAVKGPLRFFVCDGLDCEEPMPGENLR